MSLNEESLQKYKIKLNGKPNIVFNDYKKTSMYIPLGYKCTGKCWVEKGFNSDTCHNWENNGRYNEYLISDILNIYNSNPFYEAVVISGMESFDNFEDLFILIKEFRKVSNHDIVIYTGYNENEIQDKIDLLKQFENIYLKVGRYIKDLPKRYDDVLKVELISNNQYGIKIS